MGGVWATSFVTIATARGAGQVSTAMVTEAQNTQEFIVTNDPQIYDDFFCCV